MPEVGLWLALQCSSQHVEEVSGKQRLREHNDLSIGEPTVNQPPEYPDVFSSSFRLLPVVYKIYKAVATLATGSYQRAKVSSVYEERGRKRSKGEQDQESENSSKSARLSAKARTDGLRARKALSIISNNRTMVTRSMEMKTIEKKDEEILFEVEVIEAKEEVKNDDNKPVEQMQQQPINEVVAENEGDDGGLLTLDDWPLTWSYEEEWSWFKVGYECGWYSY
ncbi:hypothetical protein REPUB_Repub12eG0034800 [Reevesia pubescens]